MTQSLRAAQFHRGADGRQHTGSDVPGGAGGSLEAHEGGAGTAPPHG